jgi:nicotinate-nucleotide pyrophosphorylase (carboxylating)
MKKIIALALKEDIGSGDITGKLIPQSNKAIAYIYSQDSAVFCGRKVLQEIYKQIDPRVSIKYFVKDGDLVCKKQVLCHLSGLTRSLLAGERTALNFLQTLSSASTLTKIFVNETRGTKTKILDTRKTLPGLRELQKYAVTCGGGKNHRHGLYDAILIKENHIMACGSVANAIQKAKKIHKGKPIEIEVRNLKELQEALKAKVAVIMLDNFKLQDIKRAVKIVRGKTKLEVSGGVTVPKVKAIANTGVDYISVGALTKTVMPVNFSMLLFPNTIKTSLNL